jgi:hypothetical protein
MKKEIYKEIKNLTLTYKNIENKYSLFNIIQQYKLDQITRNLVRKILIKLFDQLIDNHFIIKKLQKKLRDDDLNIEELNDKLPNPNLLCNELKNCSACTPNPSCGWCASTNICLEGSKIGPNRGICKIYNFEKCPEKINCSKYKKCDECMSDTACGWCSEINLSLNICMTKNEGENGLCNSNFFHHAWKNNKLGKCPKIRTKKFIEYIQRNLHESNEFDLLKKDSKTEIEPPHFIDKYLKELNFTQNEKISGLIEIDRVYRENNKTKIEIKDLEKKLNDIENHLKLNDTIKEKSNTLFIINNNSFPSKDKRFERNYCFEFKCSY